MGGHDRRMNINSSKWYRGGFFGDILLAVEEEWIVTALNGTWWSSLVTFYYQLCRFSSLGKGRSHRKLCMRESLQTDQHTFVWPKTLNMRIEGNQDFHLCRSYQWTVLERLFINSQKVKVQIEKAHKPLSRANIETLTESPSDWRGWSVVLLA